MSVSPRVTLRDLARVCGVHLSTVSLALNQAPSIPPATRRRVEAVAEELGYCPNVAARNLVSRRTGKSDAGSRPIAWINQEPQRAHWHIDENAVACFDAACRRAARLGYHLEEIWTREPGMTSARAAQIVRARGIEGVLFPIHRHFDLALRHSAWNEFSLVGINDHRLDEWMDVVSPDYYANAALALRRLHQIGFTRVGFVQTPQFDAATRGQSHGSFLRWQNDAAPQVRVPVCRLPDDSELRGPLLRSWLSAYRPAAVLCGDSTPESAGASTAPGTVWIPLRYESTDPAAGIDDRPGEVAAAAVECVVEKIRRFEKGGRASTRTQLVKGSWRERADSRREIVQGVA